jgi:hypothetical protein
VGLAECFDSSEEAAEWSQALLHKKPEKLLCECISPEDLKKSILSIFKDNSIDIDAQMLEGIENDVYYAFPLLIYALDKGFVTNMDVRVAPFFIKLATGERIEKLFHQLSFADIYDFVQFYEGTEGWIFDVAENSDDLMYKENILLPYLSLEQYEIYEEIINDQIWYFCAFSDNLALERLKTLIMCIKEDGTGIDPHAKIKKFDYIPDPSPDWTTPDIFKSENATTTFYGQIIWLSLYFAKTNHDDILRNIQIIRKLFSSRLNFINKFQRQVPKILKSTDLILDLQKLVSKFLIK